MRLTFDPEAQAGYVYIREGDAVNSTLEFASGSVMIDFNAEDAIVGVEFLGVSSASEVAAKFRSCGITA